MRPIVVSITGVASSVNSIALSQTATSFTLNGSIVSNGVAVLANAQFISLTSATDQSAKTITVVGIDPNGATITETITGPNATTVASTKYYSKVLSVTASVAATLSVGVSSTGGAVSPIITANWREIPFNVGLGLTISGTATATVENTFDDINDTSATLNWYATSGLSAVTASAESNYAFPCRGVRLRVSAYTSGTITLTYIQA